RLPVLAENLVFYESAMFVSILVRVTKIARISAGVGASPRHRGCGSPTISLSWSRSIAPVRFVPVLERLIVCGINLQNSDFVIQIHLFLSVERNNLVEFLVESFGEDEVGINVDLCPPLHQPRLLFDVGMLVLAVTEDILFERVYPITIST